MQDLGGGERTTALELVDGVKTSGQPKICQEYSGTLRSSMRECREGGLNMNFMESYFCQVSSLSPCLPFHPAPISLPQAPTISQQGFGACFLTRFPASGLYTWQSIFLLNSISQTLTWALYSPTLKQPVAPSSVLSVAWSPSPSHSN